MATAKASEAKTTAAKASADKTTEDVPGAVYTVTELAECATKLFGENVKSECVIAAFRVNKRSEATVTEAKDIVEAFMKKEVK